MGEISQQDIINAIVALDGKKLKELQSVLREQYVDLNAKLKTKKQILTILDRVGIECVEGRKCADDIKIINEQCSKISELLDKIHRALGAFS